MVLQVSHLTSLILSLTKSLRPEICLIRTLFTKEHFCVKTTKFMRMATKMITLTSTIYRQKLGQKNDEVILNLS